MNTIYLKENQSIADALSLASPNTILFLQPKGYREKLVISIPNLTICGTDSKSCIIYDDYANKIHTDGKEFNTFRTYTVCVTAENVTFKNLTIENDSYSPKTKGQAVALSVYGTNFKGENLTLKSAQDTLFLGPLPDDLISRYDGFLKDDQRYYEGGMTSHFSNCSIFGSVDYIFGCSDAFFYNCRLVSIDDGREQGFVCAPAHSLKQKHGFTFYKCLFTAKNKFNCEIFLARPWRDYGKCTFIDCEIGDSISPLGFDFWKGTERHKTARFEIYNCNIKNPVSWCKKLDALQASEITKQFLSN